MKFILAFLLACLTLSNSAQLVYSGLVLDSLSGEPLPYATVRLQGTSKGTSSNAIGAFSLVIEDYSISDSLEFSYMGYESQSYPLSAQKENIRILLKDVQNTLEVFVVRPITAAEQVRLTVRAIPRNYSSEDFMTKSYYRQVIQEGSQYIDHAEGAFLSHHRNGEKKGSRHQLVLFRKPQDLVELNVFSRRVQKQRKKYLKEHPEHIDSIPSTVSASLRSALGGPAVLFTYHVGSDDLLYLDTTKLSKFKYEYGKETVLDGHELISIDFKSRGSLEHVRRSGTIYIDKLTDAIVTIKERGTIVIPAWVQPILLLVGVGIKKPHYSAELRYHQMDSIWYPEFIYWNLNVGLVDRRLFKKSDRAAFYLEQLLHIQDVEREAVEAIPENKRFDHTKPMEEQVYPVLDIGWDQIDIIR